MKTNMELDLVIENITNWIKNWFEENGKDCKAVIGISGGKDSTITAMLLVRALGVDSVYGVLMPNGLQTDINDSYTVVKTLGIPYTTIDINPMYTAEMTALKSSDISSSDQTMINLPPRLRMTTLYAVSQSINGRVVNTSNASEAYVGYCTKFGDTAGDLAPLLNLRVEEIIEIGRILALKFGLPEDLIIKAPADGLTGKTDEDNLGFTYTDVDNVLKHNEKAVKKEKLELIKEKHEFAVKKMEMKSFSK